MIINENSAKTLEESNFICAVCRKGVGSGSNYILWKFFRSGMHKRCIGIRGKLKEHDLNVRQVQIACLLKLWKGFVVLVTQE